MISSLLRPHRRKNRVTDKPYLAWLHTQSCVSCQASARKQMHPTEAAHIGLRGLGQKCSDREAIALCGWCHREGPHSHHRDGKHFFERLGRSRDSIIRETQERYELEAA